MPGDDLILKIETGPSADALFPVALHAEEELNQPFLVVVDFHSATEGLAANDFIDKAMCISVNQPGLDSPRYFHGVIRSWIDKGGPDGAYNYRAEIVPAFWFTSQTADCRIYHDMTTVDILTQIFGDYGISDYQFNIQGSRTQRPYTVQFNETDLDFCKRLMEEEGYFYFFTHTASAHTMVVADDNVAFTALANATLVLSTDTGSLWDSAITGWQGRQRSAEGKYTLYDYDPMNPSTEVTGNHSTLLGHSNVGKRDVMEWPALTTVADTAGARAKIRQEAAEADHILYDGGSTNSEMIPGGKFTVDQEYVIRRVVHDVVEESKAGGGAVTSYTNNFTAWPSATKFRAPLDTKRPVMAGIYSAVVLGPSGQEIYTDDQGHVKVLFFWDWRKEATSDNTLWCRVLQPWAGNGWGMQNIPRVGTEVAVAFVDGDPDHPVVLGGFFNATQTYPLAPGSTPTITGLRSRSSPGGGDSDYNEFSFDDNAGSEVVNFQAQKDFTGYVKNDWTMKIDNNYALTITNGKMETTVSTGNQSNTVSQGNQSNQVDQGNWSNKVSQGNISTEASAGNISDKASAGDIAIEATAGKITVTAGQSITLKVGGSSVTIDNTGVTVKGTMLSLKGDAQAELGSPMTTVKGDGMLTLKGGMVMIN